MAYYSIGVGQGTQVSSNAGESTALSYVMVAGREVLVKNTETDLKHQ